MFTYTSSNEEIDPVNIRVLEELQRDPRLTMSELGRRVGMSSPAVTERVHRLEEAGVIQGYRRAPSRRSASRAQIRGARGRQPGWLRGDARAA